jgi:hypothetical protein
MEQDAPGLRTKDAGFGGRSARRFATPRNHRLLVISGRTSECANIGVTLTRLNTGRAHNRLDLRLSMGSASNGPTTMPESRACETFGTFVGI